MNIIGLVGSFCVMALFHSGVIVQTGHLWWGMGLSIIGTIGLGFLVAAAQSTKVLSKGRKQEDGLTLRSLVEYTTDHNISPDVKLWVADQKLHPADSVFYCLLDGKRALVIERRVEGDNT